MRQHPIVGQQANAHKNQQSCTMPLDTLSQPESRARTAQNHYITGRRDVRGIALCRSPVYNRDVA